MTLGVSGGGVFSLLASTLCDLYWAIVRLGRVGGVTGGLLLLSLFRSRCSAGGDSLWMVGKGVGRLTFSGA